MSESGGVVGPTGGFSSDDKTVLERTTNSQGPPAGLTIKDDEQLFDTFELNRCVKWIKDNQMMSVTLQFPDSLLQFAPAVAKRIQEEVGDR